MLFYETRFGAFTCFHSSARLGSARLGSIRFDSTRLDSAQLGSPKPLRSRVRTSQTHLSRLASNHRTDPPRRALRRCYSFFLSFFLSFSLSLSLSLSPSLYQRFTQLFSIPLPLSSLRIGRRVISTEINGET